MKGLKFRDAEGNDAPSIAQLIYETEELPEQIWGEGSREEILRRIEILIRDRISRYSYLYIKVAEYNDNICGAAILLPSEKLKGLDFRTSIKLLKLIKGLKRKGYFLLDLIKGLTLQEAEEGELYIGNIAIGSEYRGKGIGKELLAYAELVGKQKGYPLCSLLAKDKELVKFYEKCKYSFKKEERFFSQYLYKMAKMI